MLGIGAIAGIGLGASEMLQGYSQHRGASKMAGIMRGNAQAQYEYNKKEIGRAFEKNFLNTMDQYTMSKKAMIDQATNAASTQNVINNNQNNVDNEFNSYKTDSINQLDSQLFSNMNKLVSEQVHAMSELTEERIAQDMNNSKVLNNTLGNISSQQIQSESQGFSQFIGGATRAAGAAVDYQGKYGGIGATIGGLTDNLISSFGYNAPAFLKSNYFGLGGGNGAN